MNELKLKIVGITTDDKNIIASTNAKTLELNGGHSANICYTEKDFDEIVAEPIENTLNRATGNKKNRHHSVFGHDSIKIYFEGIPKIIAMLINGENEYNTSEKSGRFTIMTGSDKENALYAKWKAIFEREIKKAYPEVKYLTDSKISNKAKENARYLLSLFMRTKMEYTTSFRQWNYLCQFTQRMIDEPTNNALKLALKPYLEEFRDALLSTGFITGDILDGRDREFSLIKDFNRYREQFGRSYSVNYLSSIPALADILRHRSLDYSLSLLDTKLYFTPPIILPNQELADEWLDDISGSSDWPQGMLVHVNETGSYENFIMKLHERLCTNVQLEAMQITRNTLERYVAALADSTDPSDKMIYDELMKYMGGAPCTFPNHECTNPCYFKEGMTLKRRI